MEGTHQQVHRDHSGQRRRMCRGGAEDIRLAAENVREHGHDCKSGRGPET